MRGTTGPTVGTGEQTQLRETSGSKAHLAPFYLADPRPPADIEARPAVPVAEPGLAHRRSHTPAIIGTAAVVVLAALKNALKVVGKQPSEVKVVFNGVGEEGVGSR